MKWKIKKIDNPKSGDIRKKRVFAWKKTKVDDYWVWLETYEVTEKYFCNVNGNHWWTEIDRKPLFLIY